MPKLDDLWRNATLRQVRGSLEVTRTFRVSGIIAAPEQVLFTALNFVGIPEIGDSYPGLSNDYRVRAKRVQPDGKPDAALVIVTYSDKTGSTWNQETPPTNDGQDVKRTSSTLQEYTTSTDVFGDPMTVTVPPSAGRKESYLSKATVRRPVGTIVFERVETSPPAARLRNMVGTINSDLTGVYPARSLLFTRLDSNPRAGGREWEVTYEFAFDSFFWVHRDRYTRSDGKVPVDATEQTFFIYQTFDFNTLGLDFSDGQTPI